MFPGNGKRALLLIKFKKGDRKEPGNYRGINHLCVVGKVFHKILNNNISLCITEYHYCLCIVKFYYGHSFCLFCYCCLDV